MFFGWQRICVCRLKKKGFLFFWIEKYIISCCIAMCSFKHSTDFCPCLLAASLWKVILNAPINLSIHPTTDGSIQLLFNLHNLQRSAGLKMKKHITQALTYAEMPARSNSNNSNFFIAIVIMYGK